MNNSNIHLETIEHVLGAQQPHVQMSVFITRLTTGCMSTFQMLVEVEKMPDIPQ